MKKILIADVIKASKTEEDLPEDDGSGCSLENKAGCKEYNSGIGDYAEYAGSYYDITVEFDYKNDNYVITIDYHKGQSDEKIVDGTTAEDFVTNGLNESKRNPAMTWPFGSLDFLHWPNQVGK